MAAQHIACLKCGTPNLASARFCATCGQPLNAAPAQPRGAGGRDLHNSDKLPLGEFIGEYVITGYLNERSRGTTSLFSRRTYVAESANGKTHALLHEAPDENSQRALNLLAQIIAQPTQLLHLPRLLMPATFNWYGAPRTYVVEPLPVNALGPAQLQEQTRDKWETWTHHLAIGLALLNKYGLALGLREGVPYDEVLRHVTITVNATGGGVAYWKDLSDLTLIKEVPEAKFADVRALAGAMQRSKLSGSPGVVAQLLAEAAQPGARVVADRFAAGFGEKKLSTIPVKEDASGITQQLAEVAGASQVEHASATHKGLIREGNEDTPLHIEFNLNNDNRARRAILLAVADGMGGEEAGEQASLLTVHELANAANAFVMSQADLDANAWVQNTVARINDAVMKEAQRRSNQMGATLVFALVCNGIAYLGNVGDSRIYRWNPKRDGGRMVRLTKDHSLVQRLVDMNQIDDAARYTHPERNMVLRSIGDPQDRPIRPEPAGDDAARRLAVAVFGWLVGDGAR